MLFQKKAKIINGYINSNVNVLIPLLILIIVISSTIVYKEPKRTTSITGKNETSLIAPLGIERINSTKVDFYNSKTITDSYFGDEFIYYVKSDTQVRLYVYDIKENQVELLFENSTTYSYEDNYIEIIVVDDLIYIATSTGLYYLDNNEVKPIFEHSIDTSDIQYIDYYGAFYLDDYSDSDDTNTLFYETKEAKYIIEGTSIMEYPLPYDPLELPYNLIGDSPVLLMFKLAINLRKYTVVKQENGPVHTMSNGVVKSSNSTITMSDLESSYGYIREAYDEYDGVITIDGKGFLVSHENYPNSETCDVELINILTFCIDQEHYDSYITVIDDVPYLVEIEYNTWSSVSNMLHVSNLKVLPSTFNTAQLKALTPLFTLGLLFIFIPILKYEDPFID